MQEEEEVSAAGRVLVWGSVPPSQSCTQKYYLLITIPRRGEELL